MKAVTLFWFCMALTFFADACEKDKPQLKVKAAAESAEEKTKRNGSDDSPDIALAAGESGSSRVQGSKRVGSRTLSQWPQFHGPSRDNISRETLLLKQWPPDGPTLLWTATDIGDGFATVAVANRLIYTTGNIGDDTVITALNLDGSLEWTAKNGPAYKRSTPGTRGTPTIDNARVYHENADGDIVCLDAKTGKTIWSLNMLEKFHGRNITWGLAESLLVDRNNLICTPGGESVGMVALDKNTSETVWVCKGTNDKPGYCSPIVFEYKGIRQIVTMLARSVIGVNADNGALLWQFEHITPYDENINVPIFHNGCIFVSTQTTGSRLLRLDVKAEKVDVEQLWHSQQLENQHGGVLLVDGCLYGTCRYNTQAPWACLDIKTGKRLYSDPGIGRSSLTCADGMLYALNHKRTVALVRPSPHALQIVSRFTIPSGGRGPTWAHPVVCNGRLYIRHGNFLYCYDVEGKPK